LADSTIDVSALYLIAKPSTPDPVRVGGAFNRRAQLCEQLTEAQLRTIELEENEHRKALTEAERSANLSIE
jgi:hypothetical protein